MDIINNTKERMQKSLEVLHQDFSTVRSGRANPTLVENVSIEAYEGTRMRLLELASIVATDAQTLVVSPYDKSVINKIQRGLEDAHIGISPVTSGDVIRIVLPPLTEERRREFVKLVHQKAESGKVMVRQVRQDAMGEIKKQKDTLSEDEVERLEREVQKSTDDFIAKIDVMRGEKEAELMRI
jgi:ribosome recycling factor